MATRRGEDRRLTDVAAELHANSGLVGQPDHLGRSVEATTLGDPHVEHVDRFDVEEKLGVLEGHERLVGDEGGLGGLPHHREVGGGVARERLLQGVDSEHPDSVGEGKGLIEVPGAVRVEA